MRTSETTDKLDAAIAKAQTEIKNAPLNKVNPHFKSKYADLAAIRDAVIPILAKHGVTASQHFGTDENGQFVVTTRLAFAGQWISGDFPISAEMSKLQAVGSAVTYARRYSLAAAVCIAADEDDDANAAQKHAKPSEQLHGPLGITALKNQMKKFAGDLADCNSESEIDGVLASYNAALKQCERDLSDWWLGDGGDVAGARAKIEARRKAITAASRNDEMVDSPSGRAIQIPITEDGLGSDWMGWGKLLTDAINTSDTLVGLNNLMIDNATPLLALKVVNSDWEMALQDRAEARRGFLAQAPEEAA